MKIVEKFDKSQRAIERGAWLGRQSDATFEVSQRRIEQSACLLEELSNISPTYRTSAE